jgi:hypothetical protein
MNLGQTRVEQLNEKQMIGRSAISKLPGPIYFLNGSFINLMLYIHKVILKKIDHSPND